MLRSRRFKPFDTFKPFKSLKAFRAQKIGTNPDTHSGDRRRS